MILNRHTISLCPTCYKEIPAAITIDGNGVWMRKTCSIHGETVSMVERDPLFYTLVAGLNSPSIYGGHFVDVTRQCQLNCKYCYYPIEKDTEGMFTIARIVEECQVNAHRAPFILTGGEPTLRKDIVELIKAVQTVGPVELLTNGVRLADPELFDELMPLITNDEGQASLNLSIHLDQTDKSLAVIDACRRDHIKIESCLIVVDSEQSFFDAVELARICKDVVLSFRIKAATCIWNEQKPTGKIFVSDMIHWLERQSGQPIQLITQTRNTKSVFANVAYDGMFLMLLSWHDVTNVDLIDISCAPTYRARNGEVANFVTAALINEGMAKGFLRGEQFP